MYMTIIHADTEHSAFFCIFYGVMVNAMGFDV